VGKGPFVSEQEFVEFRAVKDGQPLKLAAGYRGKTISSGNRFSISGGPYEKREEAELQGSFAKIAVLRYAVLNRLGINFGQHSTKAFRIYEEGKRILGQELGAPIIEDHLGITIYEPEPQPRFVGMNATGMVSRKVEAFVFALESDFGKYSLASSRAETATDLYLMGHFETGLAARFLALFMSFEALIEYPKRSDAACALIDDLIDHLSRSSVSINERQSLTGSLAALKRKSITQAGKDAAQILLLGKTYSAMEPADYFGKMTRIRNDIVHNGKIVPSILQDVTGEFDRFVSDALATQFVEPKPTAGSEASS
jgi:hypothetical protein